MSGEIATSPRRRGRPSSTRAQDSIRQAATVLFAEHGYWETSVRDIAARAGVDATLIARHFGSKEALFIETMTVAEGPSDLVEGPLDGLGRALLQRLVGDHPEQAEVYAALARVIDRPDVRAYLQESTERHIITPLAARLTGADARLRAQLIAAQIAGLWTAVWVMRAPSVDELPLAHILDTYAIGIQGLIDGPASH